MIAVTRAVSSGVGRWSLGPMTLVHAVLKPVLAATLTASPPFSNAES